jgi:hypothetical protein
MREVNELSIAKKSSEEWFLSIKKLGKLYLYLLILGRLVFLMQRVPLPVDIPIDSDIVDFTKFIFQSFVGNEVVKSACILALLLYFMFVAIESLMELRHWCLYFYSKHKKDKAVK